MSICLFHSNCGNNFYSPGSRSEPPAGSLPLIQFIAVRKIEKENRKRKKYTYEVGQKFLVKLNHSRKFGDNPYKGPYKVIALKDNGTIGLRSPLG